VAQGNALMQPTLEECARLVGVMVEHPNAPTNATALAAAIINCRVDLPMSRNLALLESLAND
jgi:hypothetical protein